MNKASASTQADREVARLLNEPDPVTLELADLVAQRLTALVPYASRPEWKVLVAHFPDILIKYLR